MIVARSRIRRASAGPSAGAWPAAGGGAAGVMNECRCGRSAAARSGGIASTGSRVGCGPGPTAARAAALALAPSANALSKPAKSGPAPIGPCGRTMGPLGAWPCRKACAIASCSAGPAGRKSALTPGIAPRATDGPAPLGRVRPGRPRTRSCKGRSAWWGGEGCMWWWWWWWLRAGVGGAHSRQCRRPRAAWPCWRRSGQLRAPQATPLPLKAVTAPPRVLLRSAPRPQ